MNNMQDQLILSEDCGTNNGIMMNTEDPNIVDRFTARSEAGLSRNTLITPQVMSQLRKKTKAILVRSPMTCELNDGVCQKCYGHNEHGQAHTLGTNVGIRSAQAITEPLTQFQLSAKHGVRQAVEDKTKIQSLKGLRNLLEIPPSFTNKATLATEDGNVTRVERAPQGGYNVFVGTAPHYIPTNLDQLVRVGQPVTAGDALSDGVPMPNEIVQYKGMGTGRKYLVDQLHDVYKTQGLDVDKRHLEMLARAHLNHVRIDEDPENRFYPGEMVNYATLMRTLAEDTNDVTPQNAIGRVLARGHLHHVAGTSVTPQIAKELSANKFKKITVAKQPPKVSFIMESIIQNPLLNPDWMARLGHRYLKESILEGAEYGEKSNIHGPNPIPAYAFGQEFGKGPSGRY